MTSILCVSRVFCTQNCQLMEPMTFGSLTSIHHAVLIVMSSLLL